ncbi:MAG: hypothetical protein LBM01_02000 [Christensenellaceae bacterium]|jgi:protein-arginine kinase activator protein McsA|nr:hypothetical protein [Christensenellaceae bacterium]
MLCEICGQNIASLIRGDSFGNEIRVCMRCLDKPIFSKADLLADLIANDFDIFSAPMTPLTPKPKVCPCCGYSFEDFREFGELGCSECYKAFAAELAPVIARLKKAVYDE